MTISNVQSYVSYTGNGSTKIFSVPFEFWAASDLLLRLFPDKGTNPDVYTTLVYGTDYTVAGGSGDPGQVTLTTAPAVASTLDILNNMALGQPVAYQAYGQFPAEAHEQALDRLSTQIKQIQSILTINGIGGAGAGSSVLSVFGRDGDVIAVQGDYQAFYSLTGHVHTWSEITNKPTEFTPVAHTHDFTTGITGKPATYPPSGHTHVPGDITDFTETSQDITAAQFVHAGHVNISVTYDDTTGLITLVGTGGSGGGGSGDGLWNFVNNTTMADPGSGNMRMNAATYLTTTQIALSHVDLNGEFAAGTSLDVGDILSLSNQTVAGQARYTISNAVHNVDYSVYTVVVDSGVTSAGGPNNNNDILLTATLTTNGVAEAPNTGLAYARKSLGWVQLAWGDVSGKPTTFTPSAHTHTTAEVTGLDTALAGKAAQVHTHVIGDVTNLQTTLDGKSNISHTHTTSQVTGLDAALLDKETVGTVVGINTRTAAYTFVASDRGQIVEYNSATAGAFTLNTGVFTGLVRVDVAQIGAGLLSITPGAGVTINGAAATIAMGGQWKAATLYQRTANNWVLVGGLA
jgi:hypothetical protein